MGSAARALHSLLALVRPAMRCEPFPSSVSGQRPFQALLTIEERITNMLVYGMDNAEVTDG